MKWTQTLLNKELDGDLSHSETVELERASWTDPDLRRARQGWKRTTAALAQLDAPAPKVPVERWAERVLRSSRGSASSSARWTQWTGLFAERPWTLGAVGVTTALALAFALWPSAPAQSTSRPFAWVQWQARPTPPPAPVEIRVEASLAEEGTDVPVSIRF